jgi:hypothetical protein
LSAKIEAEFHKYSRGLYCDQEIIDLFCAELIGEYDDFDELDFERLPLKTVEYIFSNHYDFFGLIPQNLAIDENNLIN